MKFFGYPKLQPFPASSPFVLGADMGGWCLTSAAEAEAGRRRPDSEEFPGGAAAQKDEADQKGGRL